MTIDRTNVTGRMRPDVASGGRPSLTVPRAGRPRPAITITTITTMNGAAVSTPGCDQMFSSSDSIMPIATAAAVTMPNEVKRPTSAAAIAGSTISGSCCSSMPVSGAISTPASAASADPSAQLIAAIPVGEKPSSDAPRSFSEAACVPRPSRVNRKPAHSRMLTRTATPSIHTRSSPRWVPPNSLMLPVGNSDGTSCVWLPQIRAAKPCSAVRRPSVATTFPRTGALRSGRTTATAKTAPKIAAPIIAKIAARYLSIPAFNMPR